MCILTTPLWHLTFWSVLKGEASNKLRQNRDYVATWGQNWNSWDWVLPILPMQFPVHTHHVRQLVLLVLAKLVGHLDTVLLIFDLGQSKILRAVKQCTKDLSLCWSAFQINKQKTNGQQFVKDAATLCKARHIKKLELSHSIVFSGSVIVYTFIHGGVWYCFHRLRDCGN